MRSLDDGPPLFDLSHVVGGERLRRLLVARPDVLPLGGVALLHGRVGERADDGGIELSDDVFRCSLWRPQSVPVRDVQAGNAGFVDGWNIGREVPARL